MSGPPVNLNRFRKRKAREEKRAAADANAARHGRTRAGREVEATRAAREAAHLDGHRRERAGLPRDDDGDDGGE